MGMEDRARRVGAWAWHHLRSTGVTSPGYALSLPIHFAGIFSQTTCELILRGSNGSRNVRRYYSGKNVMVRVVGGHLRV